MNTALLMAEFASTPWAMMPERIHAAGLMLARHEAGFSSARAGRDVQARRAESDNRRLRSTKMASGGIAVLSLCGMILQRPGMMTDYFGGVSTMQLTQRLREVVADSSVDAIILDVDSPGGSVYGVQELADEILRVRNIKPIIGYANSLAASAAYWIAASCSEFYVTPGGEVGSIGVYMAHADYSKFFDNEGIKTTLISAGKFKTEGNPYEPLGSDAVAFLQSRVNDYYGAFTRSVAKGRNVPVASVRSGMGQSRVLGASAAVAEKMVDGVLTMDELVRKVQSRIRTNTANSARFGLSARVPMQRYNRREAAARLLDMA